MSVRTLDGHRPYPINLESAGLCEASVCLIVIEGGACWPPVVKERLGCPLAIVDLSAYWTSYTYERLKLSKCMPELKGGACWASGVNERPGRPLEARSTPRGQVDLYLENKVQHVGPLLPRRGSTG